MKWHGHVVGNKGTFMNTVLQGKVEETRGRGRSSRELTNGVTEWMQLDGVAAMRRAEDRVLDHQNGAPTATAKGKKKRRKTLLYSVVLLYAVSIS